MSRIRYSGCRGILPVVAMLALCTSACTGGGTDDGESLVPPQQDQPLPKDTQWTRHALIGGADLWEDFTEAEVATALDTLKAQGVNVAECDSGLSQYLTDAQFENQLNLMRMTVRLAHQRDMKVVWYYPSLEVLTDDAANVPSMAKDHPDWLQVGIHGAPNVFVGTQEFWVDPGTESAWMCPNHPGYRDYFFGRIRKMAKTGMDGIWPDVPLFMDTAVMWSCANDPCRQQFRDATRDSAHPSGLEVPAEADVTDPVFRRWLNWRHETIDDFLRSLLSAAQAESPNIFVAAETFTVDYLDAMDKGLDGTFQRDIPGFTHMWEIDSVSNSGGMKCARPDDWTSKIAMFKFARGVDHSSPSWAFSYGNEPLDAGLVMAEAFATQTNPYELKTPQMLSTVSPDFRKRWFGWAGQHLHEIYDPKSTAEVAVVYSSASRDYQDDQGDGFGMYATTEIMCGPDPEWWSTSDGDAAWSKVHVGDYRGMVKLLTHAHVPFEIVPSQALSADRLKRTKVLILPAVAAMSDAEVQAVSDWVEAGGTLIATGDNVSMMDEQGAKRAVPGLVKVLDLHAADFVEQGPARHLASFGKGRTYWYKDLLGQNYFDPETSPIDGPFSYNEVTRIIRHVGADPIWTDAPREVHFETYGTADGSAIYIHVVNFTGLKAPMVLAPVMMTVELRLPEGRHAATIEAFSPEEQAETGPVPFETQLFGRARFTLRVGQYSLVKITLADGATGLPPQTVSPIADPARAKAVQAAWDFVKKNLRDPSLPDPNGFGVFTNQVDVTIDTDQYAYGHNVTSEHVGLMLLAAAALGEKDTFDGTARYVRDVMRSPFQGLVNWAVDKSTLKPMVQVDEVGAPPINGNAPLDDFRVIRGLLLGHRVFGNPEYLALARELAGALRWTSVTDTDAEAAAKFSDYPGGVVGYAFNWVETAEPRSGEAYLDDEPLPIDYSDLAAIDALTPIDPWWTGVARECARLMIAAEIPETKGLFRGSYYASTKSFSGDFEMPDVVQGKLIKTIQTLWTSLHLARYGAGGAAGAPDASVRKAALQAAHRGLDFFKAFYAANSRVPEYLTPAGTDVPNCVTSPVASPCLSYSQPGVESQNGDANLYEGEPRIYALIARLAVELGDPAFAELVIADWILPWQDTNPTSAQYGNIGADLAGNRGAEAWNVLESILAMVEAAGGGAL